MLFKDIEITPILDGSFRLDGGSMFGIIPKTLWEKKIPADERNRIQLVARTLLVRMGNRTILIDTGQGNKFNDKFRDRYAIDQPSTLIDNLLLQGVRPADVTDVINCHLHFDHAGWNTVRDGNILVPGFPNARYWSQRGEWERARHYDTQRDQASFAPEDYLPLDEPHWELISGEKSIVPGVEIFPVPGHSPYTQAVLIRAGDQKVAFLGDLIPTIHHVPYPWIMAFDLNPVETLATKRLVLPQAVKERWICIFDHDPNVVSGRIFEQSPGVLGVIPAEEFLS